MKKLIFVVADDEPANLEMIERYLTRHGHLVHTATNGVEAIELLEKEPADVLITDIDMPLLGGREVLLKAKNDQPMVRRMAMSGKISDELREDLNRLEVEVAFIKTDFVPMMKELGFVPI